MVLESHKCPAALVHLRVQSVKLQLFGSIKDSKA
jgi:hypothetical protein